MFSSHITEKCVRDSFTFHYKESGTGKKMAGKKEAQNNRRNNIILKGRERKKQKKKKYTKQRNI